MKKNINPKELFDGDLEGFRPETETCPNCGAKGCCSSHGAYGRCLIAFCDGQAVKETVTVARVKCSPCGATHAVLLDYMVPYDQHSLYFILLVLEDHYARFRTIETICEAYSISRSTFYRWKKRFIENRKAWLGVLKAAEKSLRASVRDICQADPFADLASGFWGLTGMSILQTHRDQIAHSRRKYPVRADFFPDHTT